MSYALTSAAVLTLRDAPKPADAFLVSYWEDLKGVFLRRLEEVRRLSRPLTEREEKELRFMVEELIRAKNSSYRGK